MVTLAMRHEQIEFLGHKQGEVFLKMGGECWWGESYAAFTDEPDEPDDDADDEGQYIQQWLEWLYLHQQALVTSPDIVRALRIICENHS